MCKPRKAMFTNGKRMKKNLSFVRCTCPRSQAKSGWQNGSFITDSHHLARLGFENQPLGSEISSSQLLRLRLDFPVGMGSIPCLYSPYLSIVLCRCLFFKIFLILQSCPPPKNTTFPKPSFKIINFSLHVLSSQKATWLRKLKMTKKNNKTYFCNSN